MMQLYHGLNGMIEQVDLSKSRPFKDFGRGFYCTNLKLQAEAMARRVAKLYGGVPFVSVFQMDEKLFDDSAVNIMTFESLHCFLQKVRNILNRGRKDWHKLATTYGGTDESVFC